MTLDSYRLVTRREKERGEYLTELTYNGKKVNLALSEPLRAMIDELGLKNIKILTNYPQINRLEVIISGEDLK